MKPYTSIPKWSTEDFGNYVFGFDKVDGSNIRAEWDRKLSKKSSFTQGFKKFGTRSEVIHKNSPFAEAIFIFEDKYVESLNKIFVDNKLFKGIDKITVYGEFFGENSFAGSHIWTEPHDIKIFDVFLYKKNYLPPADFIKAFDGLDIAKPLFQIVFEERVKKMIEKNELGLKEGVVCKWTENGKVHMFKVKTEEWLVKVKNRYGEAKMLEY
jgi:hypothetical protein